MILQVLIAMVAGWVNRHQQQVFAYLQEEKRALKAKLPPGCLRLMRLSAPEMATEIRLDLPDPRRLEILVPAGCAELLARPSASVP